MHGMWGRWIRKVCFAPDEGGSAVSGGTPSPSPAPGAAPASDATPTTSQVPPPSSVPSQGGPGAQTGFVAPPAPGAPSGTQAQTPQTVRDVLAAFGYETANQYSSDAQALQHLVSQARLAQEQQQLVQYGQQYLQHAGPFQQWLQQQQAQQQQAQQQQASWWKAPEFDPAWSNQIYRDPTTGELKTVPGAPLDAIQKYTAWTNHQQKFLNDFSRDPISAIRPGIEQVVQQVASNMVQQMLRQQQEQSTAQSFIQQHSDWLHERDQSGQVVIDPRSGRPALSNLGQNFARYVFEAEKMGLYDSQSQQNYALTALQRDVLLSRLQGQTQAQNPQAQVPVQTPGDAAKAQFLQQAAGQQVAAPGTPLGNANGTYQSPQGISVRGLQEMMMRDFAAAGIAPGTQLVS